MAIDALMSIVGKAQAWRREIDWKAFAAYSVTGVPAAELDANTLLVLPSHIVDVALVARADHKKYPHDLSSRASRSLKKSARETVHSPPIRIPFSATERFISSTTGTSTNVTTANIKKTSK
jgi:hypothetical protein